MHLVLLLLAGFLGGLTGSVAGVASIVTYPALLALGLPPVTANVTNTVALVFNGVGSVSASGIELRGRGRLVATLAGLGAGGGLAGAALLLRTPPGDFERAVPWCIMAAAAAVLLPRRQVNGGGTGLGPGVLAATGAIAIYAGYFGAAAGVLVLALILFCTAETVAGASALRNVVTFAANVCAAAVFVVVGHPDWSTVPQLAAGLLVGGRLGPGIVRRMPAGLLRGIVAAAGFALSASLLLTSS